MHVHLYVYTYASACHNFFKLVDLSFSSSQCCSKGKKRKRGQVWENIPTPQTTHQAWKTKYWEL